MIVNLRTFLFNIGFFLVGVAKLCQLNSSLETLFLVAGLGVLMIKICLDDFTKKQWCIIVVLVSIGCMIFLASGEMNPVSFIIVIFSMNKVQLEQVVKLFFWMSLISFIGIFLLCKMGVLYDDIYYFTRPGVIIARHSYGFGHPNQMFLRLFIICVIYITYYGKRHSIWKLLGMIAISLLVYRSTNSRTGFLCTIIFFTLYLFIYKGSEKIKDIVSRGMIVIYYIMIFLSLCFIFVSDSLVMQLDQLISGRITLTNSFFSTHPITLFGTSKELTKGFVLDNSYIYILAHYGIVFFTIYIFAIGYLLHIAYKEKQTYIILLICVLHVYAFMERVIINPMFNYCIIFIGILLMSHLKKTKRNKEDAKVIVNYTTGL